MWCDSSRTVVVIKLLRTSALLLQGRAMLLFDHFCPPSPAEKKAKPPRPHSLNAWRHVRPAGRRPSHGRAFGLRGADPSRPRHPHATPLLGRRGGYYNTQPPTSCVKRDDGGGGKDHPFSVGRRCGWRGGKTPAKVYEQDLCCRRHLYRSRE